VYCSNKCCGFQKTYITEDSDVQWEDTVPDVIACATMWHESKEEMIEMFKSILRLDLDQCTRRVAKDTLGKKSNYYNFTSK